MITVISGTNRSNSKTEIVSKFYFQLLSSKTEEEVKFLNLTDVPLDMLNLDMYTEEGQSPTLAKIQDEYLINADKWVIVSPEYNGSFPGILKLFIDAVSVRKYHETFKHKKLGLIGVASGRAGNLRGMDQLTNAMNYLGFSVYRDKLPISQIKAITNETEITDEGVKEILGIHADNFLNF